jgi:hypothetical protein
MNPNRNPFRTRYYWACIAAVVVTLIVVAVAGEVLGQPLPGAPVAPKEPSVANLAARIDALEKSAAEHKAAIDTIAKYQDAFVQELGKVADTNTEVLAAVRELQEGIAKREADATKLAEQQRQKALESRVEDENRRIAATGSTTGRLLSFNEWTADASQRARDSGSIRAVAVIGQSETTNRTMLQHGRSTGRPTVILSGPMSLTSRTTGNLRSFGTGIHEFTVDASGAWRPVSSGASIQSAPASVWQDVSSVSAVPMQQFVQQPAQHS